MNCHPRRYLPSLFLVLDRILSLHFQEYYSVYDSPVVQERNMKCENFHEDGG